MDPAASTRQLAPPVVFVSDPSLATVIERFLTSLIGLKSPATIVWYKQRLASLARFIGDQCPIGAITLQTLREWRASLANDVSVWTLHGYCRAARRLFTWLIAEGLVEDSDNPARRLALPRLPRTPRRGITDDARDRIMLAARGNPRDYALVWFLNDTLCRVGGLVHLKVGDVNLKTGDVIVNEKGGKGRRVFLEADALQAMRDWLLVRKPKTDQDAVFTGKRGPLTIWGVYQILERLAKRAGVTKGWNPHNWRHGGARAMLEAGASLGQVSQYLGHSDIKVTNDFYGTFADDELREAHRRYHWRPDLPKDS